MAVLAFELLLATVAFDTRDLAGKGGLLTTIGTWAPNVLRFGVALVAAAAVFGYPVWRRELLPRWSEFSDAPVRWGLLALHAASAAAAGWLSTLLFWRPLASHVESALAIAATLLSLAAVLTLAAGLVPIAILGFAVRSLGFGWVLSTVVAGVAVSAQSLAQSFWRPSADLAFRAVELLLRPVIGSLVTDPASLVIGSSKFSVAISPDCSGYEGVALVIAFSAAWLWFFRSEYRFPAALILAPVAAAAMWLLNCLRIAALILIGHFGAPSVALGGFHSQAGWLALIFVTVSLCVFSRRIPALSTHSDSELSVPWVRGNDTALFLLPFLAILAAGMVSRALSGPFEWLYPLRLIAAAVVLWAFRKHYASLPLRFGGVAVLCGAAVFVLWVAVDGGTGAQMSPELAEAPGWLQALWISLRIGATVFTVPFAEELAFRGFLLRRLAGSEFSSVSWRRFQILPVVGSSLAFGALHGERWLEGTIAGVVYAWAMARTGRIGEAIAAHAITNALLAGWVLATGQWQFW